MSLNQRFVRECGLSATTSRRVLLWLAVLVARPGCFHGVTALTSEVCVETTPDEEMVCTRDVLETRRMYDGFTINVGVTQRVDGTDSEKQAIRDVLKHMDHYFFHEVLALPEYAFARSRW
jgi:hypothetical protein